MAGIRISISKSDSMVHCWKMIGCSLSTFQYNACITTDAAPNHLSHSILPSLMNKTPR